MKKILWLLGALALVAGTARADKIAYLGVATVPVEPALGVNEVIVGSR